MRGGLFRIKTRTLPQGTKHIEGFFRVKNGDMEPYRISDQMDMVVEEATKPPSRLAKHTERCRTRALVVKQSQKEDTHTMEGILHHGQQRQKRIRVLKLISLEGK